LRTSIPRPCPGPWMSQAGRIITTRSLGLLESSSSRRRARSKPRKGRAWESSVASTKPVSPRMAAGLVTVSSLPDDFNKFLNSIGRSCSIRTLFLGNVRGKSSIDYCVGFREETLRSGVRCLTQNGVQSILRQVTYEVFEGCQYVDSMAFGDEAVCDEETYSEFVSTHEDTHRGAERVHERSSGG